MGFHEHSFRLSVGPCKKAELFYAPVAWVFHDQLYLHLVLGSSSTHCARANKMRASRKQRNLRPQLTKGRPLPLGDAWVKEKWPERGPSARAKKRSFFTLLDAHYQCITSGPFLCLQDCVQMINGGKVSITCPGVKKEKEPRTLSEQEVHVIKTWYDDKVKKLTSQRGDHYVMKHDLMSLSLAKRRGETIFLRKIEKRRSLFLAVRVEEARALNNKIATIREEIVALEVAVAEAQAAEAAAE